MQGDAKQYRGGGGPYRLCVGVYLPSLAGLAGLTARTVLLLLLLSAAFGSSPALAEIYKYVDEQGVMHFSDRKLDNRYRPLNPRGKAPKVLKQTTIKVIQTRIRRPKIDLRRLYRVVREYGAAWEVDPLLIMAMIKAESDFDPLAVSRAGARGLMQLMPQTAREMGVRDSFDPSDNVKGGIRYFGAMRKRFRGNLKLSLAAYNAGPESVARFGGVPPYKETRTYIRRVARFYREFRRRQMRGRPFFTPVFDPIVARAEEKKP